MGARISLGTLTASIKKPCSYSAIKTSGFESVLARWMQLELVIQSEVKQKEKNKYILMHIFGIQNNSSDELTCREETEMQAWRTDLWTQGREERV